MIVLAGSPPHDLFFGGSEFAGIAHIRNWKM